MVAGGWWREKMVCQKFIYFSLPWQRGSDDLATIKIGVK